MREIEFRGKLPCGEWVYGDLYHHVSGGTVITSVEDNTNVNHLVDPETVGQYTGLKDRNGVKIFEGYIVKCYILRAFYVDCYLIGEVKIIDGCADVVFKKTLEIIDGFERHREYVKCFTVNHSIEVIGNIHDNPELLEEK